MSSLDIFKEYETIDESINNLDKLNEEFFDFDQLYTNQEIDEEIYKEKDNETYKQKNDEIDDETDKQKNDEINDEIDDETDKQKNDEIDDEIDDETDDETDEQKDDETDDETDEQKDDETDDETDKQKDDEIDNEIDNEIYKQKDDEIDYNKTNENVKKNIIEIKNIINSKEWYNIGKKEINDIQKIISNNVIIETINKDEIDIILNTIKSEIKDSNKIKDKIINGFLNIIKNKYINKYNKNINEQIIKNENDKMNIILKQKENKKLIHDISKYKINVMNMIKKHKENILVDNIYNYNYEDNINEEITKNIINKYIYIIEITKKIIYIIQKYIDNKTSKKINDILIKQMMKINKFIGICKIYEINKNKEIYYILRNENKIDKNNELYKNIKNIILLYETIIEKEYESIIEEIEYVEGLIENDIDFYINFEFNCYNEYVKKYGSKNLKNIYYKDDGGDKTKKNIINDIRKSIETNINNNISQCILTDELGRGLLYGTKKDVGILNLLSNSCIEYFELKEIIKIDKNNVNIEKSEINIINDINLDRIKGKDIYLLDKSLVKNYEENDTIKEEYKIKKNDGEEYILTIITFKGNDNYRQEEIINMKKEMIDKLSYIDLNKYTNENIDLINHIKDKTRLIYIKNIETSNKLNRIMENV
mgnify:CR=1 FL=1